MSYTHIISTPTPRTSWHEDEFVLPLEDLLFHSPTTDSGRLQNRKFTSCFWPIRVLLKCYSLHSSTHYHTSHLSLKGCPLGHTTTPNGVIVALYVLSIIIAIANWISVCNHFSMSLMSLSFVSSGYFSRIILFNIIKLNYISENITFYSNFFEKMKHNFIKLFKESQLLLISMIIVTIKG